MSEPYSSEIMFQGLSHSLQNSVTKPHNIKGFMEEYWKIITLKT